MTTASTLTQPAAETVWEVESLRTTYVVRPANCLGTCGWHNGKPWQAIFTKSASKAAQIARQKTLEWKGN